jgi:ABC-type branched-subunit amino acid transport system substrate-binding protein
MTLRELLRNRLFLPILLGIILLAIIGYIVLRRPTFTPPDNHQVRVAAILNLTGPSARFDAVKQQTLNLAVERIKIRYPDVPIELRIFDAAGSPETTAAVVRQATEWGASYFLSGTSPTALAIAAQVRNRNPVVVQMANAATPEFGPPRPGEYRLWVDWRQEAEAVISILQEQKLNKVLLIHSADPYSQALTGELREQGKNIADFTAQDFQFDPASTPDFRPAILRAKSDGSQAIIIFGLPPGIQALMTQMSEIGWDKTLIGGVNINLATAGFDLNKLKGSLWVVQTEAMQENLTPDSEPQLFRQAYQQQYKEIPAFHSLYIADALYFIAESQNKNKGSQLPAADQLKSVTSFVGASGQINLNQDGTLRFILSTKKVK